MLVTGVLDVRDMVVCRGVFVGVGVGGRTAAAHLVSFGVVGKGVAVVVGVVGASVL